MRYRFDEIAYNSTAKKKPTEGDKDTYIGLEHLDSECLTISRWGSEVAPVGEKLIMKKGDILFGKRRAYQRKVGIAPFDGIFSAHGMVLRPNEEVINKDFFPFFISSDQFMERAVRISVGGLSPTINWKDLREQEFDIPSLDDQKVLADKLWAAYNLKESYKKLLSATDEMVKSQFIEMFGNPVTNDKNWETMPMKDIAPEVPSTTKLSGSVWLLNLDMIESHSGQIIEKVYEDDSKMLSVAPFDTGNVLYSKLRPYLNKVVVPDESGYATTELVPLRPNPEKLNRVFLSHLLRGDNFVNYANSIATGTKMPRMPLGDLRKFKCILPPMDMQAHFVDIAEQADKSKFTSLKSQFIEMFYGRETTPAKEYLDDSYPGEWGTEDNDGNGVKVIRTTNFTNAGKLNLEDVVTRNIEERKVTRKQIRKFDTILERSGGTADNPVGRVVLFEDEGLFLCNNFTQVLRFKDVDPRYAFYALYFFYQTNKTAIRSMGSKTTGIQNLNMSKYLEIGIPNATQDEQYEFVRIAEQADKSKYIN